MILDEEAPGGICDERGWTLDLFASADEAPGRAAGEASAALAAQQEPDTAPVGRPLFTGAADEGYDGSSGKGETRALLDVAGQAVLTWRSGDLKLRRVYDALRRPRALFVDEGSGERLVQLTVYGDAVSDADAGDFALGKPLQVYDTAGRVTLTYDFRGRTVAQTRQVYEDITTEADWDALDGLDTLADIEAEPVIGDLSAETFTVATAYDALDRVTEQTAPDTSRTAPGYDAAGRLVTVRVYLRGAVTATDFVTGIIASRRLNARGQRESITYANNTETSYEYDAQRLWLSRILTNRSSASTHGAATLQDLGYTRDAVGNITGITDDAQEDVFFDNEQVTPDRTFLYDALYRLVEATGREKVGQTQTTAWYSAYAGTPGTIPDETDPALRTYSQSYTYDEAGNILEMAHVPSAGSNWTRYYQIAAGNNQLLRSSFTGDDPEDPDNYTDVYAYNDRGAMVTMPHLRPAEDPNITRDFRDQIRTALLVNSAETAWYSYDAGGQRVRKLIVKAASTEERIYVGPYEIWRQRDGSGDLQEERTTLHVMAGERRIAMAETLTVTGGVELDDTTTPLLESRLRYQLDDHLGTALLEVDEDGGIITYEEFHPYGTTAWYAEKIGIEVSAKRYRYTGMERDDETGLQYHSARYYVPWLGRWTSSDPAGILGGVNRTCYCEAAPTIAHDREGLEPTPAEIGAARESFFKGAGLYTSGTFTWVEKASAEARSFRAAIEGGVPNHPSDPTSGGSLDTIPISPLLAKTLGDLRDRALQAHDAGDPREVGAIYFVTRAGTEGIIYRAGVGEPSEISMQEAELAMRSFMEERGLSDSDVTVVDIHAHPVHTDGTISGYLSTLKWKKDGTFGGDLLHVATDSFADARIVTIDESGPMNQGGVDIKGNTRFGPGSVLAVRTQRWQSTIAESRRQEYLNREFLLRDPLQSGTQNPETVRLGDYVVTQSQARAGYSDLYVLYDADVEGPFERVRFGLPGGTSK